MSTYGSEQWDRTGLQGQHHEVSTECFYEGSVPSWPAAHRCEMVRQPSRGAPADVCRKVGPRQAFSRAGPVPGASVGVLSTSRFFSLLVIAEDPDAAHE